MGPKSQCTVTSHRSLSLFFFLFLSLFFFFNFSFFLSSSLSVFFLFFFREKSSYSLTTHMHRVPFAFFRFSVLFVLFPPVTHTPTHADPIRKIIGVDLQSHVEKLHHALVPLLAAIELVLRSSRSVEISIHNNDGSLLETIRSRSSFFDLEALLSALGTTPLEARFFFFFF